MSGDCWPRAKTYYENKKQKIFFKEIVCRSKEFIPLLTPLPLRFRKKK